MNFQKLKAELAEPEYDGMSDEAAKSALNSNSRITAQAIPINDIRGYLMASNDALKAIEESTDAAALQAVRVFDMFGEFDMTNPVYAQQLTDQLAALKTAGLITATDETVILAMGERATTRAAQLGLGRVKVGHVQFARTL
ncbi:MAG: hypothetical protein JKY93_12515 [Gammaproteobacteria bacterium]|nr:hypothetical protein [Gammaproteobacteria bacterium]